MKVTWQGLQNYLEQVDSFDDNDGYFQSYVVKPHIVLQLNTDDAGEWDTVNYVQHMAADEDCGECIVLQITEAPEDPPNYNLAAEYDIKVFLEMDNDIADRINDSISNDIECLEGSLSDDPEFQDDIEDDLATLRMVDDRLVDYFTTTEYKG